MKSIYLHIVFMFCAVCGYAQNLVPNPSFEDTVNCPYQSGDIAKAAGWTTLCGSPDYFKSCNQYDWGVPNNIGGFQQAASGNAYAGFFSYTDYATNAREFPACSLSIPLTVGVKYFVSFKVALSLDPIYNPANCASNKIGAMFTTGQFICDTILPNTAKIHTDSVITDSLNWTRISGSFVADSAYTFLIIGNFFDNAHTDTIKFFNSWWSDFSYYYLDDVCVGTDSAYVYGYNGITGISSNTNPVIDLYPNPVTDNLFIQVSLNEPIEITINDLLGRELLKLQRTNGKSFSIDLSDVPSGVFIVTFKTKQQSYIYKLQKL